MEDIFQILKNHLKPYENLQSIRELPHEGIKREEIIELISSFSKKENEVWKSGKVSGAVYHGEEDLISFFEKIYHIYSQSNALHPDIWPSITKFEREIVSMSSSIMHGDESVRGSVTSGGTESILLAMKSYRDYMKKTKGILEPEIIIPSSAHAAFLKASEYFNIKTKIVPLNEDFTANIEAVKESINKNTVAIVGSAPPFPWGTVDPIKELSEIAFDNGIGMHVDACLGGFILPWAKRAGYNVSDFDFKLDGVTSISMDTHKYGYAPKGTSVILYKNKDLFKEQIYATGSWQGGIYFTPTMAGSRPGFPIVAAWAVMVTMGDKGYLEATKKILDTGKYIIENVKKINDLKVMGKPLWVIAISSSSIDPYLLMDEMSSKGWMLNGLFNPPAFHIALTIRHTIDGVKEKFIADLSESVENVKGKKETHAGMAPIYGMSSTLPSEEVSLFLKEIVEWLYTK